MSFFVVFKPYCIQNIDRIIIIVKLDWKHECVSRYSGWYQLGIKSLYQLKHKTTYFSKSDQFKKECFCFHSVLVKFNIHFPKAFVKILNVWYSMIQEEIICNRQRFEAEHRVLLISHRMLWISWPLGDVLIEQINC